MEGGPSLGASASGLPTPSFEPLGGSTRTPTAFNGGFDVDTLLWGAPNPAYDPGSAYSSELRFEHLPSAHSDGVAPLPDGFDRALRHQRSASFGGMGAGGEDALSRRSSSSSRSDPRRGSRGGTATEWLQSSDFRIGACGNVWGTLLSHAGTVESPGSEMAPVEPRPVALADVINLAPPRRPSVMPLGRLGSVGVNAGSHDSGGSATTSSSHSSASTAATSVASESSLPTLATMSPPKPRRGSSYRTRPLHAVDPDRPYMCTEAGCSKTFKTCVCLIRIQR